MALKTTFTDGDRVKTVHGWIGTVYAIRVIDGTIIYDVRHESGYPSVPFLTYELTRVT